MDSARHKKTGIKEELPSERHTNLAHVNIDQCINRAYREIVEAVSTQDILRRVCTGVAEALRMTMATLVRLEQDGTIKVQASSRENLLWAEFSRIPERNDNSIAGDGPSARAIRASEPVTMLISESGFEPWRKSADSEGIMQVCAHPLNTMKETWVLLLFASSKDDSVRNLMLAEGEHAAASIARLIASDERHAMDQVLSAAMKYSGNPAFIADVRGDIVWCNASFCRLTGYAADEIIGQNPRFLSSGRHAIRHYRDLWNTIRTGKVWRGETVDLNRSGSEFTALETITPFGTDGRVTHYLAMYEDVSTEKANQHQRDAYLDQDPLTGLAPQASLERRIGEQISENGRARIAIVCVTAISAIKKLGEDAVETLLNEMQERIGRILGADRAALTAPGEYLLWLPDDLNEAGEMTRSISEELNEAYPLIGEIPGLDLRVGRANAPEDGTSLTALKHRADRALGIEPLEPARRDMKDRNR